MWQGAEIHRRVLPLLQQRQQRVRSRSAWERREQQGRPQGWRWWREEPSPPHPPFHQTASNQPVSARQVPGPVENLIESSCSADMELVHNLEPTYYFILGSFSWIETDYFVILILENLFFHDNDNWWLHGGSVHHPDVTGVSHSFGFHMEIIPDSLI